MKLLVITQTINKDDPVLGFFHRWVESFAQHYEKVTVICLKEGEHQLPRNVSVLSLGKEQGLSRAGYLLRFYRYVWERANDYDAVFVHMNQEYVLLGGDLWHLLGKKVYLWRNHAEGSMWTKIAVSIADKVFCTSPSSFTARFAKTKLMPVGIDTELFKSNPSIERMPHSVLFLGRIAPIKRVKEFVEWFSKQEDNSTATIAGGTLEKDEQYEEEVKELVKNLGLEGRVKFVGRVNQEEASKLYQSHETYVNFTPAGSMDKTIFEARASGMKLVVENPDAQNIVIEDHSLTKLMEKLTYEMS